jgi:hypothetical protein
MAAPASYPLLSPDHHPAPSSKLHRSSPPPKSHSRRSLSPAMPAAADGAAGPRCSPSTGRSLPPFNPQTEPYGPLDHPLTLPRPFPTASSPESSSPRRPAAPWGHIAKQRIFPRVFLQRVTQIVFVMWLILVNCIENCKKIIKMQN